jgi:hypothetical protein
MDDSDFLHASWNLFESHGDDEDDEDDKDEDIAVDQRNDAYSNSDNTGQQYSISSVNTLPQAVNFLSLSLEELNVKQVENVITQFMGNMAQCRIHGKEIRDLGGISCLMNILVNLIQKWEGVYEQEVDDAKYREEKKLASVILGALRDLSCGDAAVRLQIGQYDANMDANVQCKCRTGIEIISYFIVLKCCKYRIWDDIPTQELKTMTNALGVARNITHSTPFNCRAFHEAGMTKVFIHRLEGRFDKSTLCGSGDSVKIEDTHEPCRKLPSSSKPWREACYRLAGTLINMAEKCLDVAVECAKDEDLIWILIESWGGVKDWDSFFHYDDAPARHSTKKAIPVLHLGLFAILWEKIKLEGLEVIMTDGLIVKEYIPLSGQISTSDKNDDDDDEKVAACQHFHLMDIIICIMENEKRRKRAAQERENERKKHMLRLETKPV